MMMLSRTKSPMIKFSESDNKLLTFQMLQGGNISYFSHLGILVIKCDSFKFKYSEIMVIKKNKNFIAFFHLAPDFQKSLHVLYRILQLLLLLLFKSTIIDIFIYSKHCSR